MPGHRAVLTHPTSQGRPNSEASDRELGPLCFGFDYSLWPGNGSDELADSFLVFAALDGAEVPRQFEHEPLVRRRLDRLFYLCPFEEVVDLDSKGLCDNVEPAGGNPVEALLILVRLLVGDSDQLRHILLGEPQQDATLADAGSNIAVNIHNTATDRGRTDRRLGRVAARHWVTPADGDEPHSSGSRGRAP